MIKKKIVQSNSQMDVCEETDYGAIEGRLNINIYVNYIYNVISNVAMDLSV